MNNFVELRTLLITVAKYWWILLLSTLVASLVGYTISSRQASVYEATTTLLVGRAIQSSNFERYDIQISEELALTYASIVQRQPILQGVVDSLQLGDSWQELKSSVQASPVEGTQLLEITANGNSPAQAQRIADAVAYQLIQLSPTALNDQEDGETKQFVQQRLKSLQSNIEKGQRRLSILEGEMLSVTGNSITLLSAQQEKIDALDELITEWESTYSRLLLFLDNTQSTNYLAVIEPAQAKSSPIAPLTQLNTTIAAVIGLILALGLIFLLENFDDTVKSLKDIDQTLGLVPLGIIGFAKKNNGRSPLGHYENMFSSNTDEFRLLRTKIQHMISTWPRRVILVTSSTKSNSKSVATANLGVVMAQAGMRTIIVDMDLRRPEQHKIFDLPQVQGLTDMLRNPQLKPDVMLKNTEIKNLRILTTGNLPTNPSQVFDSQSLKDLLPRLSELADVVLCDSPQSETVADALVVSGHVDGVILVVDANRSHRSGTERTISNLRQTGARLMGAILCESTASVS